MVVYRTNGPWGSGKGANLSPAEVDNNFHELAQAIEEAINNAPPGVGVSSFSVDGMTFTVNLTDGSHFGPFALPYGGWRWTGAIEAGKEYEARDVFSVEEVGLFLVLGDYTAPDLNTESPFDAEDENLSFMIGPVPPNPIGVVEGIDISDLPGWPAVDDTWLGRYVRIGLDPEEAGVFLPGEADNDTFPIWGTVTLRCCTSAGMWIEPSNTDTIINLPAGTTNKFRGLGSIVTAIRVGPNEWDVAGDLEIVS